MNAMRGTDPTEPANINGDGTLDSVREQPRMPTKAGPYEVVRLLGRGGMGIVYLARDPRLQRDVAIKLCLDASKSTVVRIRREAKALAAFHHPNVVDIYDIGEHEGLLYIAMEYVAGGTAKTRFGRGALSPWSQVLDFYLGAARGLAAAHRADIVHRDFKPENVLVTREGTAKVADFGLATGDGAARSADTPHGDTLSSGERVTRAGAVVGTPAFMAPEQLLGLDVDSRADQFSFCATVFEGFFGRRPYPMASVKARLAGLATTTLRWPRDTRGVPKHILHALQRGLETDPDKRFRSMDALLEALQSPPRRRWPAVAVAVAAAGLGLTGAVALNSRTPTECALEPSAGWGIAARARVEQALDGRDPALTRRVLSDLDAFAAAWTVSRDAVCGGTVEPRVAPATTRCLEDQRTAFRARVEQLSTGRSDVLARARSLTANLPIPEACDDPGHDGAPLDSTPARREVAGLLAAASAHEDAGRTLEADALSADALTLARTVDHPPLVVRALVLRADISAERGNLNLAAELHEEAYFSSRAHGIPGAATRSAMQLAPLHARLGHTEHAHRWLDIAETETQRQARPASPVDLHLFRGRTLMHLEDYAGAAREIDQALALLEDDGPPRDLYHAVSTKAALMMLSGIPAKERAPVTQRRVDLSLQLFGLDHPDTAIAYEDLATVLTAQGKLAESIVSLDLARSIYLRALGPNNVRLAELDNKLATNYQAQGDLERAETFFRRAIAVHERLGGDNRRGLVNLEANLGSLLERRGDAEQAEVHLERALAYAEQAHGADGLKTAMVRVNVASSLLNHDRFDRAIELLTAAKPILETRLDPRHPAVFIVELNLAHAFIDTGAFEKAEQSIERLGALRDESAQSRARVVTTAGYLEAKRGNTAAAIRSGHACLELLAELPASADRLRCLERVARLELERGNEDVVRALLTPELDVIRGENAPPGIAAQLLDKLARSTTDRARSRALGHEALARVDEDSALHREFRERYGDPPSR